MPWSLDFRIAAVRDPEAEIANFVHTGRDLTTQLAFDPELANARNLHTFATFAGGAAHDFNNLIMVISAYAELALHTLYHEHPLRRNLQEILAASHRASELTRQLLGFARKHVHSPGQFSINSVIEEVSGMLTNVLGEDIELELLLQKDVDSVTIDPSQLDQVLLHLALNARDAMPDGGKLVVRTQSVQVNESDSSNVNHEGIHELVEITVSDSGQLIPEDQLPRIFDPLFTTKPEGKGTGLGLTMVDGIIRQSGGFIRVESMLGRGTTFRIYLPVASPGVDRPPASFPLFPKLSLDPKPFL
jgi:two-component system cell cycle sensor histidine kinase/response regulator CckA